MPHSKLTPAHYAQALYEALQETDPKDHGLVVENFVAALRQRGDLAKWDEIEQSFREIELKEKGIHKADVTFAKEHPVGKELFDALNHIAGKKLEINTHTDDKIVGGVVMRVDDKLLNASVKDRLSQLEQDLEE